MRNPGDTYLQVNHTALGCTVMVEVWILSCLTDVLLIFAELPTSICNRLRAVWWVLLHSSPAQNQNQHILQQVFGGDSPDITIQSVWERGSYEGRCWTHFPKHLQIRHWIIDGVGHGVLGARFTYLPLSFLVAISVEVLFISTETLTLLLLPLRQACACASLPHAD